MIKTWKEFNMNEKIDIFGIKKRKDQRVLKWLFRNENQINDFLEIKKKLDENGIKTDIEMGENYPKNPYNGSGWIGWDVNDYILVSFDLTNKYTDEIIYSPLGSVRLAMREIEKIPKLNSRFDINRIVDAILNFTEKKKKFDDEIKEDGIDRSKIDPYGEENWNSDKLDEIDDAKRKEDDFWEWMGDHKND